MPNQIILFPEKALHVNFIENEVIELFMLVQVNVWGTRKLADCLMKRYETNKWLTSVASDKEKSFLESCQPRFQLVNPARGSFGSLMPKLLHFYDLTGTEFFSDDASTTGDRYNNIVERLDPYYDGEVGFSSRMKDKDNMQVYPYLHEDSRDFFTTHNINCPYADEDYLRLVTAQLHNLDPAHCFMFAIYAYCPSFDIGYQYIHVNAPSSLITSPMLTPGTFSSAWSSETVMGYCPNEFENLFSCLDIEPEKEFISTSELSMLLKNGDISPELLSENPLEVQYYRKWHHHFEEVKWHNMVDDLFRMDEIILLDKQPIILPFAWS